MFASRNWVGQENSSRLFTTYLKSISPGNRSAAVLQAPLRLPQIKTNISQEIDLQHHNFIKALLCLLLLFLVGYSEHTAMHFYNTIQNGLALMSAIYFVGSLLAPRRATRVADDTWSDEKLGFRS
jgi:hypothetical protein